MRALGADVRDVKADVEGLRVDHVTVAGSDLERLRAGFAEAGLPSVYGGPHSNGVTHMATVGFPDGSYVELISTMEPGRTSPLWDAHIAGDGGPAAWAAVVEDIGAETARLRAAGVPVEGPEPWARERPQGARAEWDLSFPGDGPPGATLPFLIMDRTPRSRRVEPDPAVAETGVEGVGAVVLGVDGLAAAESLFRRAYGWPPAERVPGGTERIPGGTDGDGTSGDVELASFSGTPVVLAAPRDPGGWLAARLEAFGPSPCAFLLSLSDPAAAERRLRLGAPERWAGRRVRWLEPRPAPEARIGVTWPEEEGGP